MKNYPPRTAWEEQIQWTRQGKLWTFPIDNEAGKHPFLYKKLPL